MQTPLNINNHQELSQQELTLQMNSSHDLSVPFFYSQLEQEKELLHTFTVRPTQGHNAGE